MADAKRTTRDISVVDPVTDAQRRALEIANTFREKIGEPQITGIVPGEKSSSTNCILARTFNANCTVGYDTKDDGERDEFGDPLEAQFGWAAFTEQTVAEAFRDAVNEHLADDEERCELLSPNGGTHTYRVALPTAIAQIAVDFDHADLAETMYEQHYESLGGDWKPINDVLGLATAA